MEKTGKTESRLALVLFFLYLIVGLNLNAKETPPPEYLKYVDEIVDDFVKDMKKEYNLHCIGSGGSMPTDVQKIDVLFVGYQRTTIEEARKIEVRGIQKLLSRINMHQRIRPFLREYPFKADRVKVSISFRDKNDDYYFDGSVVHVFSAKNKIFYDAAEKKMEMSFPSSDCRDPNNIIYYPPKEELVEDLVELFVEPYEDAVKIVEGTVPKKDHQ